NLRAMHMAVYKAAEGICQLRAAQSDAAAAHLGEAAGLLKEFAASAPTWPFQGIIHGYAAIALLKAGQRAAAKQLIEPWKQIALTTLDPPARKLVQTEVLA
ncbi:MAG TPA: hypothetical protein VF132_00155, partial [Rudaea sp.]